MRDAGDALPQTRPGALFMGDVGDVRTASQTISSFSLHEYQRMPGATDRQFEDGVFLPVSEGHYLPPCSVAPP